MTDRWRVLQKEGVLKGKEEGERERFWKKVKKKNK